MSAWNELTPTALLGMARGPASVHLPGEFEELLAGTAGEVRLLRAAGVLGVAQAAAQLPPIASTPAPEPSPAEELGVVSRDDFAALLSRLFEGGPALLVAEACALLANASLCLPPRLLPRALELGSMTVSLRQPLRRVLGKRGAWLAAQNPDWKFALLAGAEAADRRLWDEGDAAQRASFLARLRQSDPAEARQLLEKTFESETARDRAVLLPALGKNLAVADEAFLAAVLSGDRSKEVRQAAAILLSRLPASAFAGRMAARLEPCIRSERRLLRTVKVIEPPQSFSPDWKADAFEEKPPAGLEIGERGWWLLQLVGVTPLTWWEEHLKMDPADILSLAAKSEWKDALLAGFRAAIGNQPGHHRWTLAVLKQGGFPHQEAVALAITLPPPEACAAFERILAETEDSSIGVLVIESAKFPWSVPLWNVAKANLPRWLAQKDWRFRSAITTLACRIPPEALHDDLALPEIPLFAGEFAEFSRITEQRRALYRMLKS